MSGSRVEKHERIAESNSAAQLSFSQWQKLPIERRTFLSLFAAVSASASLGACQPLASEVSTDPDKQADVSLSDEWKTIEAVQEHLFPAGVSDEDGPGARQINAGGFLRLIMTDPEFDADEHRFIMNGVGWLDDLSNSNHEKAFRQLEDIEKEAILRSIARTRAGENWLATLLRFIIEALLSDPVYGGNPDQIGWRWLEHQPGFPRPSSDKKYFLL